MQNISAVPKKKPLFSLSLIFFYIMAFLLAILVINYFSTLQSDIKSFGQMQPIWILVALAAQGGTYYFNALTYQVLLRTYTKKPLFNLKELFRLSVVMLFLNQIVPSAGISGNTYFSRLIVKKGIAVEKSLSLMMLFLLTSFIAMIFLIALLMIIGIFFNFPRFFFVIFAIGILAFGVLSTFSAFAGRKRTINYVFGKISQIGLFKRGIQKYKPIANAEIDVSTDPIKILISKKVISLEAIACKVGLTVCDIFTIYALFRGFDVSISLIAVSVGYILTQVLTLLPVSPGALVLYEGGMTFFFTEMGIPLQAAITVVLLYRFLSFWLPMPFGFYIYRNLQKDN